MGVAISVVVCCGELIRAIGGRSRLQEGERGEQMSVGYPVKKPRRGGTKRRGQEVDLKSKGVICMF